MTTTFDCRIPDLRREGLSVAADEVRAGNLVVLPTDTVYGIGADAFDQHAVARLLAAKGRGPDMPVPVLVGAYRTVQGLVTEVPEVARKLIEAFWPGGLSLVVEHAPSLAWNLGQTSGTVMLRMPLQPVAIELLRLVGPMAVSSANRSGHPPAVSAAQALDQLGESVSVYLDDGDSAIGVASSVVDVTGPVPRLLREGAISLDALREVAGQVEAAT